MRLAFSLFMFASLCGCSTVTPTQLSVQLSQMTDATLWAAHVNTQSPLELLFVEVELVSRGQTQTTNDYIGLRTSGATGVSRYARFGAGVAEKNCSDFKNAVEAQKFFLILGGPISDPSGLDRDGDGFACEWGTQIKTIARKGYISSPATTTQRSYYRPATCHVGSRGGTYTIGPGGYKDYGGC